MTELMATSLIRYFIQQNCYFEEFYVWDFYFEGSYFEGSYDFFIRYSNKYYFIQ